MLLCSEGSVEMASSAASRESRRVMCEKTWTFVAAVLGWYVQRCWGLVRCACLHVFYQLCGLWVHETFHLAVVGEVFLDASVGMVLEAVGVEGEVGFAATDVVDFDGVLGWRVSVGSGRETRVLGMG